MSYRYTLFFSKLKATQFCEKVKGRLIDNSNQPQAKAPYKVKYLRLTYKQKLEKSATGVVDRIQVELQ